MGIVRVTHQRIALVLVLFVAAVLGCGKPAANSAPPPPGEDQAKTAQPAAHASAKEGIQSCSGSHREGPLSWFEDDYAGALACAKASDRPLVIDYWAPWCHTCISMKHTVLIDPSLAPLADRFVWASLDTDKEVNAAVQTKFPPQVWPTFYVIAPADESVQSRHLGAASIAQFRELLSEGERGFLATSKGNSTDPAAQYVREALKAELAGDMQAAMQAFAAALKSAEPTWPRRPDVMVSLIRAYYRNDKPAECVALGLSGMDQTGNTSSAADFLSYAAECAKEVEGEDAKRLRTLAVARLEALIDDESAPLSVDDRADAMRILREILVALGREEEARALAERQRAYLDQAAAREPTAFAAMTHNWPRAEVYVYLGRGAELIPALEKSAEELPTEYDPPYRLAWVHAQLKQYDTALGWAEKALGLAYGPRKARVHSLIAEIHKARGDRKAERAAREAMLALYESLPPGQAQPHMIKQAKEELAAMDRQK